MTGNKMNPDRATVLAWIRQALADELDDPMRVIGFKRRVRGVSYSRHWGDGRQKVDIELIARPHYAPDAIQVSLSVSFVSAGIADVARRMLPEGDEDVVRKDVVERSVLDQVMRNPPVLAFRDECELRDLVSHLKDWLKSSVIPYMDARNPVEEFAREGDLLINPVPAHSNSLTHRRLRSARTTAMRSLRLTRIMVSEPSNPMLLPSSANEGFGHCGSGLGQNISEGNSDTSVGHQYGGSSARGSFFRSRVWGRLGGGFWNEHREFRGHGSVRDQRPG
ncbi:hypothetical protein ACRJ4W_17775 [Streptomyces sp. GLT-R25]